MNGDTADVLEVSISREEGEEAGKAYTITPSGKEIQGNYIVKYETGKLTISDKETYLIKFVNDDGTELQNGYVAEGDEPKYEDGTFRPGEAATRAEIAKAIRAFLEKVAE